MRHHSTQRPLSPPPNGDFRPPADRPGALVHVESCLGAGFHFLHTASNSAPEAQTAIRGGSTVTIGKPTFAGKHFGGPTPPRAVRNLCFQAKRERIGSCKSFSAEVHFLVPGVGRMDPPPEGGSTGGGNLRLPRHSGPLGDTFRSHLSARPANSV